MFFGMFACAAVLVIILYSESRNITSLPKYIFKGPDIIDINRPGSANFKEDDWVEITGFETKFFTVNLTEETETIKRFSTSKKITENKYVYSVLIPQADPMIKIWETVSSIAVKVANINPDSVNSQYGVELDKYFTMVKKLNSNIMQFKNKTPERYVVIKKYINTQTYTRENNSDDFRINIPSDFNFQYMNTDLKQSINNAIRKAGEINSSMSVNTSIRGIVEIIPENVKKQYNTWLGKEPQLSIRFDETPKWRKLFTVPLLVIILLFILKEMFKNISWPGELKQFFSLKPPGY